VAAAFVAAWALGAGEKLASLKDWIGGLGPAGPFAFAALYALATVAAVPGFALTLVAGALFGTLVGTMAVSAGSTIGAALAFLLSRTVARRAVEQWLGRNEKFRKLDELAKRHGAILVAIVRLVPLFPFNLVNYGLGLTRIPFRTYLLWSWLCMLPGTVLYVGTADAASTTVAEGRIPWRILALVAAVGILVATLARAARRRLET
jgi:uncharacterized membrane protein YdjX (TVP38/TMEM64 family)